jgi:hypothetical protein
MRSPWRTTLADWRIRLSACSIGIFGRADSVSCLPSLEFPALAVSGRRPFDGHRYLNQCNADPRISADRRTCSLQIET